MDTMTTSSSPLPSARRLLTSLIDAISAISLDDTTTAAPPPGSRAQNALQRVPLDRRPLIVTLHVLFPALLLPALNLLDRGLVARVVLAPAAEEEDDDEAGSTRHENDDASPTGSFFLVRSAQVVRAPRRRRGDSEGPVENPNPAQAGYVVRLDAWNCTCAAFAFSAFSAPAPSPHEGGHGEHDVDGKEGLTGEDLSDDKNEWSFGGLSFDGTDLQDAEGVPLCKHLLACLLAHRWKAALGRYVMDRSVGKQEMAGIVAHV